MSRRDSKKEFEELIVNREPKSPVSEAYRELRTNLSYLNPDDPLTKIAITSSGTQEGKSLTLANLAITLANNEQDVIIIDADLRKPRQHEIYNLPKHKGLSDILIGEISFLEGVQKTEINRVKLISTGFIPPNPSELISSNKMEEVINKAEEKADFVLVDTPPVLPVTDAAILANKLDGTLLVVASHETEEEMLDRTKEKLEKANVNIIGVVLNKYPIETETDYYYSVASQKTLNG
ncbi:CpsD/CapB family tyrosine-protein kinase [Sporohalobacter salinus]|uniref:CpsD/CapB family tyrosine-protein kinase n=1 Tax=Sporohalobacter salinus TaxID=1494606 RepID=UPI00195FBAC2|nr:CpsD/CapB family tyrosine-protein kinase [Sporohalobacter salinus]MBM7622988.1 capsular exopolysaccharide synthesis family protein [Sporohalobacter salinus]